MKNKLLQIIQHYGIDNQLRKFSEENFELIEAIIKMIYPKFTGYMYIDELKQNIKEEIADNLVLLSQFILYYNIDLDDIEEIFKYKVERQLERIKAENE
jgi:NTP pyrophosphatase (non-canonical NTP hydrolase)